jgi:uncharacterized damage-inducible protein DinB
LTEFLDYYRATLLLKAEGLTDDEARLRGCPPSTLNIMGLVRHMADVERSWFRRTLIGEAAPPLFYTQADLDGDMHPGDDATLAEAVATLTKEIEVARRYVDGMSLDLLATVGRDGMYPSLRWIMVHMIEEYARHCGHADLLRERIDGSTGD